MFVADVLAEQRGEGEGGEGEREGGEGERERRGRNGGRKGGGEGGEGAREKGRGRRGWVREKSEGEGGDIAIVI